MRFLCIISFGFISQFVNAQVNPQNGSGYYEIPIYSYSDPKSGLSTAVGISYSSGNGLLVSSRAANTGQNWTLMAAGNITRKQNGEPDDQNSTSTFPIMPAGNYRGFSLEQAYYDDNYQSQPVSGDVYSRDYIDNYYPNGYIYSEFGLDMVDANGSNWPLNTYAPRELAMLPRFRSSMDKKFKQSRRALADREQDVFVYNFNDVSGEFVIDKNGDIHLLNEANLKIQKTTADLTGQNIRTRINAFTITDDKGIQYKFSAYELSECLEPEEVGSYGIPAFTLKIMQGEPTGKYTIQKWLLTEIVNPATLEKIIFNYETFDVDVVYNQTPTYQNSEGQVTESVQIMENRIRGKFKRILDINLPDGHKIDFNYNRGFTRPDNPDDDPLYKITLSYNSVPKSVYTFNYGFFFKKEIKDETTHTWFTVPAADRRYSRLCLKSIQKSGGGISEPPHVFNYYTGSESVDLKEIVPPTDCLAEDHWGYYTKNTNLDIHAALTKEAIKTMLTNATTYRAPSAGTASLGLLKSVETPLGSTLTFEYEQNDSKDADNPTVTKVYGGVRVSKTIIYDGVSSANNIVTNYYYKASDNTTSGWGYEAPEYLVERRINVWNAGNLDGYTNAGKEKFNLAAFMQSMTQKAVMNVATKILSATMKGSVGSTIATSFSGPPLFNLAMSGFIQRFIAMFNPNDYIETNTYNFYSFQFKNPLGVNYSRVEIVNNSIPGGAGKTVQEFTAPTVVRTEIPALAMPYASKQRFASWKFGLPSKSKTYNQSGTLIKEVNNTFNIVSTSLNDIYNKSCKVELVQSNSAACYANTSGVPLTDFSWEYYYPIKGRAELINTTETNYTASGLVGSSSGSMTYNSNYILKTSSTAKSNGDNVITKYYYATDYNNITPAIQEMKLKNIISTPISTETWLVKSDGAELLIDATVNEFYIHSNGEVKLSKIYKLESAEPLLKAVIGEQTPTLLIRNASYFKIQSTISYDSQLGYAKEINTVGGSYASRFYDSELRTYTAAISNGHHNEFAYTSFETSDKGGWIYNNANATSGNAVMGKKYFSLPSSSGITVTTQWISGKPARLSFWKKGGTQSVVNNSTPVSASIVLPNTETGWTYYEYIINGAGTITVGNSSSTGQALEIDELRVYPKDARMTSIGIDPLVGKISECDVNNRLRYYEYDALNRLIYIRDESKNILKKICYNFAGEPENCIDAQDASPQWRDDGQTMCEACPANAAYYSGVRLKRQTDQNPLSPTYNQYQWVTDNSGTCAVTPDWYQRTDIAYCEYNESGVITGNYIIPTIDINPCSPTYNQWGTPVVIPNHGPCIPCITACNEPEYKCINGVCVQGTWGVVKVQKIDKFTWKCTSAYCFPDGTISTYTQTVTGTTPCGTLCP